jgi:hypothetical protein
MRKISALFALALISGCSAKYMHNDISAPSAKLQSGKSLIIATPTNGRYSDDTYQASGEMTAAATRAAFARYSNNITVSQSCSDIGCLKNNGAFGYYVVPEILHWEERATEWSGLPDRIEIKVTIYDGKTFETAASTIFSGKSKWATFGGDHPQDLLHEPMNSYIDSLY